MSTPSPTAHQTSRDTERERRVLARLDIEGVATLTEALVEAGGQSPDGFEEPTVAVLGDALRTIGADIRLTQVRPGRPNLIARVGQDQAEPGLLYLGHSDVVPAGAGWSGGPFTPRRVDGQIIGRGAADMKGGLAAAVAAIAAVHAEAPEIPLTLLCTIDEEADALGIRHHITSTTTPIRYDACVVVEPTSMSIITGCRGATNLRVDVRGASAHAGRPADGASAILAAAEVIAAVEFDGVELQSMAHSALGVGTWNIGTISGGHGTSIVPDRCTLSIDRRTLPDEDPDLILGQLLQDSRARVRKRARPGTERITISGAVEMTMPGFLTDPASPLVGDICAAVRDAGAPGDLGVWTASCEAGFIARHHGAPTVVLGPGDLHRQAHQPDESVPIDELLTAARAYALIALRTSNYTA